MNSLENAKVGDLLIVTHRYNKQLLTVEKVHKSFVIAGGYKFRKTTGSLVTSDSWSTSTAKLAAQEDIDAFRKELKRHKMVSQCRNIIFENLSDSQLEQILEIANNHVKLD